MSASTMLVPLLGALGGSAVAGSYVSGAPVMDLVTSVSGAAGAAAGYVAGKYIANMMHSPQAQSGTGTAGALHKALPFIGAVVTPGLASGAWDKETVVLGAGAYAGAMVLEWAYNKYA
jgi:hypothetical protein